MISGTELLVTPHGETETEYVPGVIERYEGHGLPDKPIEPVQILAGIVIFKVVAPAGI